MAVSAPPLKSAPADGVANNTQAKPVVPMAPPVRRSGGPQQSTRNA